MLHVHQPVARGVGPQVRTELLAAELRVEETDVVFENYGIFLPIPLRLVETVDQSPSETKPSPLVHFARAHTNIQQMAAAYAFPVSTERGHAPTVLLCRTLYAIE